MSFSKGTRLMQGTVVITEDDWVDIGSIDLTQSRSKAADCVKSITKFRTAHRPHSWTLSLWCIIGWDVCWMWVTFENYINAKYSYLVWCHFGVWRKNAMLKVAEVDLFAFFRSLMRYIAFLPPGDPPEWILNFKNWGACPLADFELTQKGTPLDTTYSLTVISSW